MKFTQLTYRFLLLSILSVATIATTNAQITTSTTKQDESGCGTNDGTGKVTVSGDQGLVSYQWSTGSTADSIFGLAPGTYYVTVTDSVPDVDTVYSEGFDGATSWGLNVPTGANGAEANQWVISDAEGGVPPGSCGMALTGDNTLHVTTTLVPGAGAAYYSGFPGTDATTNLRAESGAINTIGRFGFGLTFNYIGNGEGLTDNCSLEYSTDGGATWNVLDPSLKTTVCPGGQGLWTVDAYPMPATTWNIADLRIAFHWTNDNNAMGTDPSFAVNEILIGIPMGWNVYTAVDSVVIQPGTGAPITASGDTLICHEDTADLTTVGPAFGFYNWTGPMIVGSSMGPTIQATPGVTSPYYVEWNDGGGCISRDTIIVNVRPRPYAVADPISLCPGDSATLIAMNGPSMFTWSGGDLGAPVMADSVRVGPLANQTYTLSYNDGVCIGDTTVTVTVSASPLISVNPPAPTICAGDNVTLNALGPVGTYTWSGGDLGAPVGGVTLSVSPGATQTYTLDFAAGGCTADTTVTVTVAAPAAVVANALPDTFICNNDVVTLTASGTTGGIYIWSGGDLAGPDTAAAINVSPSSDQTYTVDWVNGGCSSTDNITIEVVHPSVALFGTPVYPSCGNSNGRIQVSATGSSGGGLNFIFYNSAGTAVFSGGGTYNTAGPGTYTITVDDVNTGCRGDSITVTLLDTTTYPNLVDTTIVGVACFGVDTGSITLVIGGGTPPYSYTWSHSATETDSIAANLAAGSYSVTVADAACPTGTVFNFVVPGPTTALSASVSVVDDNCFMGTGSATAVPAGGTGPYSYMWSTTAVGPTISGLTTGTYDVTVTDDNGCTAAASGFVGNGPGPTFTIDPIDPVCPGEEDGSIRVRITSSDGPHTIVWVHDPTLTSTQANNLAPGTYSFSVINAVGCPTPGTAIVPSYPAPALDAGPDLSTYYGEPVDIEAIAGTGLSNPVWTPDNEIADFGFSATAYPTATRQYTITAEYGQGCETSDSMTVFVDTVFANYTIPNVFTPNGDNLNDYFYVTLNDGVKSMEVHIFDRWGNMVHQAFEVDPLLHRWDGTDYKSGLELDMGVYSYFILIETYFSDMKVVEEGNVTLVR